MENIPYTEDDQTHAYSSATHNEVPNDASDQFGPGSNDKFTINPVFDIQAKQRKFNAYLVGEENLSPTQDNTGKSQEYGISEEALNADDEKIISTEKEDALQEDVDGAFVPQLQYNALRTDENDIGEGRQYGIAEDVLNEYADMIIRNEREEHDLQEDVDNDLEWHIIQENARCSDENGLDNNDNTENNTEQHDVTENQEDIVIPNLYREESFKKTCFPQLWARIQPGVIERNNAPKWRKKTGKGQRGRGRGCKSASSVASWATGFMSNSDVSLISARPSKLYSGTYDIRYSSTSLILLNNKLRQEIDRLRHSDRYDTKTPRPVMDPGRHSRASSAFSLTHHSHCCDSTTPKPEYRSSPSVQWLKSVTPTRFLEKYSVNQKRHRNCFPPTENTFILDSSLPLLKPPEQTRILSPYADIKTKKK